MKLFLSSGAIVILGVIFISFDFKLSKAMLGVIGEEVLFAFILAGILACCVAMICLSIVIKCPRCGLRWYWYALSKDPKHNIMLGHKHHCPRCHFPAEMAG